MRKLILALILGLVMTLGLAACGGTATQKPIDNDNANTAKADQTSPETPDAKSGQEPTAVTIEENTVLLSQDGLVITAKELVDDSIWGLGVKVLLENNSALNLGVQCNSLIVNNYMIADLFSASVAAGKKTNEIIYLSSRSWQQLVSTPFLTLFSVSMYLKMIALRRCLTQRKLSLRRLPTALWNNQQWMTAKNWLIRTASG